MNVVSIFWSAFLASRTGDPGVEHEHALRGNMRPATELNIDLRPRRPAFPNVPPGTPMTGGLRPSSSLHRTRTLFCRVNISESQVEQTSRWAPERNLAG